MGAYNNTLMNPKCPKCPSGVLERMGFLSFSSKHLPEIVIIPKANKDLGITIYVCSLDECGYTEMRAVPGTLSTAKQIMRDRMYKHSEQPDTETSLTQNFIFGN